MNPNYNDVITLYRKIGDKWQRNVYKGCSWVSRIVTNHSGTNEQQANVYTVRIPQSVVGAGFVAHADDIVVLGECRAVIDGKTQGRRASEVLQAHKPNAFKIKLFSDNTGHMIDQHYRLGG